MPGAARPVPSGLVSDDVAAAEQVSKAPEGNRRLVRVTFAVAAAVLVLDQRTDATIDLVLGLKFTSVATQKAVTAALAKPVVVTDGAGCPTPTPKPSGSGSAKASTSPKASASST